MKLNGTEDGNVEITEPQKVKKTKPEKVEKPAKPKNIIDRFIPGKDENMRVKVITAITAALTIICVLAFLVLSVINIKDWFGIRSMEKEIKETYSSSITDSKVYIGIDIITATVEGYEDGITHTNFGDIECKKPSGTIILAYYEIDGTLRPLTEVVNNTYGIEYVTNDFEGPVGSVVVTSAADKGNYLEYMNDAKELSAKKDAKKTEMGLLVASLIIAVISACIFVLTRAGLFDKLVKIDDKDNSDESKVTDNSTSDMVDFGLEEDEAPKNNVKKPPMKTDVDLGN